MHDGKFRRIGSPEYVITIVFCFVIQREYTQSADYDLPLRGFTMACMHFCVYGFDSILSSIQAIDQRIVMDEQDKDTKGFRRNE